MEEIIKEYERTLVFPSSKKLRIFLCPIGLIGSGKTTVMKPLAEKLGLLRISSDDLRKIMREKRHGFENLKEAISSLVSKYVEQGYGIAMDSDHGPTEKKKKLEEFAAKVSMPIVWIHINPPEEFIVNKLKNFKHSWLFKDVDDAIKNYETRKPLHQNLDFDFTYTFDT